MLVLLRAGVFQTDILAKNVGFILSYSWYPCVQRNTKYPAKIYRSFCNKKTHLCAAKMHSLFAVEYQVKNTKRQTNLDSKILVPRIWFQDLRTKALVPGSWSRGFGAKVLVSIFPRVIKAKWEHFLKVLPHSVSATDDSMFLGIKFFATQMPPRSLSMN